MLSIFSLKIAKLISHVKIIRSNSNDIFFNLATEQYMFQAPNLEVPTLFLYRNAPTIVIGRHQNPWKECKIQQMKKNNIELCRRRTGGGAVYQDLGNTCFSFLTPYQKTQDYDYKTVNNQILLEAFKKLEINAEVSGRNDIQVQGRKISGSAYKLNLGGKQGQGKKALHHGTILFNVNLGALQAHLNPHKKKLQSKGVESVISRVMNLNQKWPNINHEVFCDIVSGCFIKFYNVSALCETLDEKSLSQMKEVKTNYDRLKSWQWRFGQCPSFKYSIDNKFSWGMVQITYNVDNGVIQQAKIYSDCLFPDFISLLNESIVKTKYDKDGLIEFKGKLLQKAKQKNEQQSYKPMINQLVQWMIKQL